MTITGDVDKPTNRRFARILAYVMAIGCALFMVAASAHAAVVLQYHHVDSDSPPSTSISPDLFAEHLDYLSQEQYQIWPLERITEHLTRNQPIPDKVVAISFDDAFLSIYEHAYPLLKQRAWPFTVFVSTQAIEQGISAYMTWPQLKEIQANGATIANHSHSHTHLVRRLEAETKSQWLDRVQEEIQKAEALIDSKVGATPKLFAYPFGEHTSEIERLLSDLDYVAFGQQSGAIGPGMSLTALPRFPMTNRFGAMSQFKTKVASLPYAANTLEPSIEILKGDELNKGLTIEFREARPRTQCFFEGSPVTISQQDARVQIETVPEFVPGRARINCTAPSSQSGRFYWFSHTWMKLKPDGNWYTER